MKIIIAGDFCPKYKVKELLLKKDYATIFSEVQKLIHHERYDCAIINLECPITAFNNSYQAIKKIGPNLNAPIETLYALKYAGFDTLTLANNHILDFGENGLSNTLKSCHSLNFATVGAGMNANEARKILYKHIKGKTLALINCCEHEFTIASENSAGANPLNPISQYYDILEARKKSDYVIVIVHGGHEYYQLPSTRMVETYRFFIDAGADAVINHHQHVFSGYETYKDKPIFYGLGNFCFDRLTNTDKNWNEGYAVELNLENEISFTIRPYYQCIDTEQPSVSFNIDNQQFTNKISNLNQIISSKEKLRQRQNDYYSKSTKYLKDNFEPYTSKLLIKLKNFKLLPSLSSKRKKYIFYNLINCESHRDKILYYLKNYCK